MLLTYTYMMDQLCVADIKSLPGVTGCLCGVVTVREPPTVGEERRGVVGRGMWGDGDEGRTEDVVRGEV